MTETDLAAAVRAAVGEWIQATQPAQQQAALAHPAALSAELALAVQAALASVGLEPEVVRRAVSQAPYVHLRRIFAASLAVDTPQGFTPVPDTVGTLAGRAAVLAVHGFLQKETVSYGTENGGNLFVNLVPMPGNGDFANKSRKGLRGHTDGVSFPFSGEDDRENARIAPSPDIVTLVGMRNPDSVATRLMPLDKVLAQLNADDVRELKKPQFSVRSQKTFVLGMKNLFGREHVAYDEPVLKDSDEGTYVRYSHSAVVPSVEGGPAEQASINLESVCNRVAVPIVVEPGDVLVVNNRRSLHGRGEVGNTVGGQARWLLRAYGLDTSALPSHKRHLGGHPPYVLYP